MKRLCLHIEFFKFWLPVLLWAGLIFTLSSISLPPGPKIPYLDKLVHIVEYGFLGCLLLRALKNSILKISDTHLFLVAVILTFFYGASDEVHQLFVPGRRYDICDILADGIGGLFGAWLYFNTERKSKSVF